MLNVFYSKSRSLLDNIGISLPEYSKEKVGYAFQWITIFAVGGLGVFIGHSQALPDKASNFLGIFLGTIAGLILHPLPGQAMVLIGVALVSLTGILPIEKALSGYSDPIVWLVLSSCLLSKGMIKTRLGKRLSLHLIRILGKNTLGLGYALVASDMIMGTVIPSNGARNGGILFPIAKGLCEVYDSKPGPTASRLGSFIYPLLYQADVIICAMFLTGQASNILIAKFAKQVTGHEITYGSWLVYAIVPGILSLIAFPLLLYKFFPPSVKHNPSAPQFAHEELEKLGPISPYEKRMILIFGLVAGLWMTASYHHLSYTVVAILGICLLVLTNVINWDDVISEKGAWDVFIWYGGLVMLAAQLQDMGISQHFANTAAQSLANQPWAISLAALLLIYYYAHYWFASVTAHVTAMLVPFLTVAVSGGAPSWLTVLLFAVFSNLSACLTHFGTTPGPIYFGAGYVSQKSWWKIGFLVSLLHILIWGMIGMGWWKLLGKW